jgi:hypothetical protein
MPPIIFSVFSSSWEAPSVCMPCSWTSSLTTPSPSLSIYTFPPISSALSSVSWVLIPQVAWWPLELVLPLNYGWLSALGRTWRTSTSQTTSLFSANDAMATPDSLQLIFTWPSCSWLMPCPKTPLSRFMSCTIIRVFCKWVGLRNRFICQFSKFMYAFYHIYSK